MSTIYFYLIGYRRLLPVARDTQNAEDRFGLGSCVYNDSVTEFPDNVEVTSACDRITFLPAGPTVSFFKYNSAIFGNIFIVMDIFFVWPSNLWAGTDSSCCSK